MSSNLTAPTISEIRAKRKGVNLDDFICSTIPGGPTAITSAALSNACRALGCSEVEFCDVFALRVAVRYREGSLTWTEADVAMNSLSGYFFTLAPAADFPDFAYSVFLAFDEGERFRPHDNEVATQQALIELQEALVARAALEDVARAWVW